VTARKAPARDAEGLPGCSLLDEFAQMRLGVGETDGFHFRLMTMQLVIS
jgi:hypothetical protein